MCAAIVDSKNDNADTALHVAAKQLWDSGIKVLLAHGASVDLVDAKGRTALLLVCSARPSKNKDVGKAAQARLHCLETLLQAGASPNATDATGATPLHSCCEVGDANCVEALLRAGAECGANHAGDTPLHLSAVSGHVECMKTLVLWGRDDETAADASYVGNEQSERPKTTGYAPPADLSVLEVSSSDEDDAASAPTLVGIITAAVVDEKADALQKLVVPNNDGRRDYPPAENDEDGPRGVDDDREDDLDDSGGGADQEGSLLSELLDLQHEKAPTGYEDDNEDPYAQAFPLSAVSPTSEEEGTPTSRSRVSDAKEDSPESPLSDDMDPTHLAIWDRFITNAVRTAQLSPRSNELVDAAANMDAGRALALLNAGASPNICDGQGRTPLHHATFVNAGDVVRILYDCGADVDVCDAGGNTALHVAGARGAADILEFLLSCAAPIDQPNDDADTALHLAAWMGNCDCVACLLRGGANAEAINALGLTPLDNVKERSPLLVKNKNRLLEHARSLRLGSDSADSPTTGASFDDTPIAVWNDR
ncbi:hypothetical protein CTAYLR_006697 [Chrysophaeum taylorii]|uniref:Uncharacterized protein n=1 Tax=Chrysophaeum taylorii TaxID=2483200 RepID=A0AAD7XP67_9STRA|nr:hypothetical protein CTAYLR_006697 [Chrysophaeum taylorii]